MFSDGSFQFFWYVLTLYVFFTAIWMFIQVFADIFRRENLSGWGKAGWIIVLFVLPFLGVVVYMLVRPKNAERDQRMMPESQAMQARMTGGSSIDDIARAKDLLDRNAITQAEYEAVKAKALA